MQQDFRDQGGVGDTTAPPFAKSRSTGDLVRFSYRDSLYNRLSLKAICNDDGTPIAATTNELLGQLIVSDKATQELLRELIAVVKRA